MNRIWKEGTELTMITANVDSETARQFSIVCAKHRLKRPEAVRLAITAFITAFKKGGSPK